MEIIRDLLTFIAVMFALCIVLIIVVSNLSDQNPLKRILTALSYRVGATLLAGAVAVPVEPIPGLDVLYDIGVPLALIWYWFTFFRDALQRSRAGHVNRNERIISGLVLSFVEPPRERQTLATPRLEPVIDAFETLASKVVRLSGATRATFVDPVHPVHQCGAVYAWTVAAKRQR
jgi:hypothetical protein